MLGKKSIGFIGAGNMAGAIIKGLCASAKKIRISASDPRKNAAGSICRKFRVKKLGTNADVAAVSDVIIIAVKPQDLEKAMEPLKGKLKKKHLVVSIAAGVTIKKIQGLAGAKVPVVRVMPNTPALVGEGACGYAVSAQVKPKDIRYTEILLSSFCKTVVRVHEKKMNAVTAVSGSGPAYFFYLAEAMIEEGARLGLSRKNASELAARTMLGAGKLILESGEGPAVLRKRVTSKGGTTRAAIEVLDKAKVRRAFMNAVLAAKKRGDKLGG